MAGMPLPINKRRNPVCYHKYVILKYLQFHYHAVEIDEGVVMQLVSMGFDLEGCKKGVFNTQNQGTTKLINTATYLPQTPTHSHTHTGVEPAMNWILEHMETQVQKIRQSIITHDQALFVEFNHF